MSLPRYLRRMDRGFWEEVNAVIGRAISPEVGSKMGPYHSVPEALHRLAAAKDRFFATWAYDVTLDSVGHNHSGSVYAVLVPATPFLIRIALEGRTWAQVAALQVLTDAVSWLNWAGRTATEPDPREVLRCFEGRRDAFLSLATDAPQNPRPVRRAAEEFLEALDDAGP